jgi:hypothetical protein
MRNCILQTVQKCAYLRFHCTYMFIRLFIVNFLTHSSVLYICIWKIFTIFLPNQRYPQQNDER